MAITYHSSQEMYLALPSCPTPTTYLWSRDMSKKYTDRAYKPRVIKQTFDRAQSLECDTLLQRKTSSLSGVLFVTTYCSSTHAEQIKRIVKSNWAIIDNDTMLNKVFPEPLISFRSAPTLSDMHSHLPADKNCTYLTKPFGTFKTTETKPKLSIDWMR